MHPEEIKAAMRMKGVTPTALAEQLGVANSTMSQVINGKSVSARVMGQIAKTIGKPVTEIWPPKATPTLRRVKPAPATAA